jgi:hypothetical protein
MSGRRGTAKRLPWDGKAFAALEEQDQIRLRDCVLRATIIEQIDPSDHSSMFHIFERLNTGGTSLRPQEIRNCIFHGTLNDSLIQWNLNTDWRKILGARKVDKRMRDVELLARFLALTYDRTNYKKPMNDFISRFMDKNRNPRQKQLKELGDTFSTAVARVVEGLGNRPFNIKAGLNAAVMDSVMVAFAQHPNVSTKGLEAKFQTLLKNDAYQSYTSQSTTDTDSVKHRIKLAAKTLFG